jgi:ADP-ribose pyrophosphatase YjhB (NUDIX family)
MITNYVLGFAFDDLDRVALICKNKPKWQAGKWNGIGCKIEGNESTDKAMAHQFHEETGVFVPPEFWRPIGLMHLPSANVCVFTYSGAIIRNVFTAETEEVRLFTLSEVNFLPTLSNIPAQIALCKVKDMIDFTINFSQ